MKQFDKYKALIKCAKWLHVQLGNRVFKEVPDKSGRVTSCNYMIFIVDNNNTIIYEVEGVARYMVY